MIKIKKKYEELAFGFIMSMKMSFLMVLFSTLIYTGFPEHFTTLMHSWLIAWAMAYPLVIITGMITNKITFPKVFTIIEEE